jgi:hypothetical protein
MPGLAGWLAAEIKGFALGKAAAAPEARGDQGKAAI